MSAQPAPPAEAARRQNSFDYLRLLLASLVIISHSSELRYGGGKGELLTELFGTLSLGMIAVNGFFVLSGYLMTQSWLREPKFLPYFRKRILRIYPGFIVAALVTGLVIAPFGTNAATFWSQFNPVKFFLGLPLLQLFLPPSFQGLPFAEINGSLWTIPYEFLCYIGVFFLGTLHVLRRNAVPYLVAAAVLLMSLHVAMDAGGWHCLPANKEHLELRLSHFSRFAAYYLIGICLFLRGTTWETTRARLLLCGAVLFAGMFSKYTVNFVLMFCGAYLLLYAGGRTYRGLAQRPLRADYSYGVYLYGWTILQMLLLKFPAFSPWMISLLALPLAFVFGVLSWHLVEKPFLKFK
jgi:peptidoglycan/LPS O-acetylase OafA/YrhL